MLVEYEEQTENLSFGRINVKRKDLMPQENFDLVMGQDYVILQLERWIGGQSEDTSYGIIMKKALKTLI